MHIAANFKTINYNPLLGSFFGFRIRIDLMRIQIQHFFLFQNRIQGFDDHIENITYEKFFIYIFITKNCNLLIARPP